MNIYVGNLDYNLKEDELGEIFAEYGEVISVKIVKDRETGRAKGFGFVEMAVESEGIGPPVGPFRDGVEQKSQVDEESMGKQHSGSVLSIKIDGRQWLVQ